MGYKADWMRDYRKKQGHLCPNCGKLIDPRSQRCLPCQLSLLHCIGKMPPIRKGENAPTWKGGRVKDSGGYILIYKPDHPKTRQGRPYVFEHVLVWEEMHGTLLPKGWIIHHLNGIKDDNRPKNLVAMPNRKHYLVFQAKAKRIQELEALLNSQHQLL